MAFNAGDLQRLLTDFTEDAIWQTGRDLIRGHDKLAALFSGAFGALAPQLTIYSLLIEQDRAACELQERIAIFGVTHEDFIAGFYHLDTTGRITLAKIYH